MKSIRDFGYVSTIGIWPLFFSLNFFNNFGISNIKIHNRKIYTLIATAPSWEADKEDKEPPKLPMGVRAPATMRTSEEAFATDLLKNLIY